MLPDLLVWVLVAGTTVGLVAMIVIDSNRRNRARRLARAKALAEPATPRPVPTDMELIRGWIDESERLNSARFDSLKLRIFWTPLLWALIGAAFWALLFVVGHP